MMVLGVVRHGEARRRYQQQQHYDNSTCMDDGVLSVRSRSSDRRED